MNFLSSTLSILILVFIPSVANASGGGPLLLIFNSSVFIVGQIWIISMEYFIYKKFVNILTKDALKDVIILNVFSTISIAFLIPLIIAGLGIAGGFLQGNKGEILAAFGTWVCDGCVYNRFALGITFFWFFGLFVMTVYFEAFLLEKKWKKRGVKPGVSLVRISWYMNSVSYMGLLIGILVIWSDLLM